MRARRFVIGILLLFTVGLLMFVHRVSEGEDMLWFESHKAWEDVQFITGEDSYAFTTFYDLAAAREAELNIDPSDTDASDEYSGSDIGFISVVPGDDDDVLRVYLPIDSPRLSFNHIAALQIGETIYHSGDEVTDIISGKDVTVRFLDSDGEMLEERSVRFYIGSGIPALYIHVQDGDIREIANDKTKEAAISYETVNADGTVDSGGAGDIRARGNNNKSFAKKSYSLNLDNAVSILGMENASKWALRATPEDYTMLMDRLVLDTAKAIDVPYSVDAEHVNVYIDGEYEGVYLLTQRVEVKDGAVNMNDGYLMEFESDGRYAKATQGLVTNRRNVVVHSPENLPQEELDSLASYVQEVEDTLYTTFRVNPTTGKTWFEYLDASSWIKQYWIQEFYINLDADYTSTYMTKEQDDPLLYAGPCWDFDKTFWHTYYNGDYQSNILTIEGRKLESWLQQLEETQDFYQMATRYYLDLFASVARQIDAEVPVLVDKIGASLCMMYDRYQYISDGEEYVADITATFANWYASRLAFYEDYLTNPESYVRLYFDLPNDVKHYVVLAVKKGEPVTFNDAVGGCEVWTYEGGNVLQNGAVFEHDTAFYPMEDGEESAYEGSAD